MWGRLSSLAANPHLASLSQLTKDGIGQLSKITTDVLAEVKAAETRGGAVVDSPSKSKTTQKNDEGDGWFGESDDELQVEEDRHNPSIHHSATRYKNTNGNNHHEDEEHYEKEEKNGGGAKAHLEDNSHSDSAVEVEGTHHPLDSPQQSNVGNHHQGDAAFNFPLHDESLETLNTDATHEHVRQEEEAEEEEEEQSEMKEPTTPRIAPSPTTSPSLSSFVPSIPSKSNPSTPVKSSRQPSALPTAASPSSSSSPSQLHRLQQQMSSLTSQLSSERISHQREVDEHNETRAQVDDLRAQVDLLYTQLEEERNINVERKTDVESLHRRVHQRDEEVTALTERLEGMKEQWERERAAQQAQIDQLSSHLKEQSRETGAPSRDEAEEDADNKETAYTEMVTQYLAEQARLEGELEEMREKYDQAIASQQPHSTPLSIVGASVKNGAHVEDTQRLQDEVAALQAQLEERDSTVYELQSQLDDLRQQLDDYRQSVERTADLEAELQRMTDEATEAREELARHQDEAESLKTELESRETEVQQLSADLEQQRVQADEERTTLLQRLHEAQAAPASAAPTSLPPAVDQTAIITQLHQTVEKLRRIIHRLTTERNDSLTVIQSVQNGLMAFAEANGIDVSEDQQGGGGGGAEDSRKEKESEEERRRRIQTLVDKVLAGIQIRLQHPPTSPEPVACPPSYTPPAVSSAPPSPSLTALNSQLSALQSALAVERETSAARQVEVDKLRRVKEEMIAWKEKASAAMAKMKDEKKEKERTLLSAMQEKEEEWERRMYETQQKSEEEVGALKGALAQLEDQLQAATQAVREAHVSAAAAETTHAKETEASALLAQRTQEVEELRATVAGYLGQMEDLQAEVAVHLPRIASLESTASTVQQQQDQLAQLSSTLTQLTQEKRDLNTAIQQHDAALHTVRTQLQVAREEAAARIGALEAEGKEQREKVVELERELSEERERTERGWEERDELWKAREDDYAVERDGYLQQIEDIQHRLTESQEQWKAEVDSMKETLEAKSKDANKAMEEERKREKRERIVLEGRMRELIEEREQERKEREEELKQLREGGGDRKKFEEQLSEKDRILQQMREERNQDHIAHLHALKALRDECEQLKLQHAELMQRWQEQTEVEKELHDSINERQHQLQTLQATATQWQHRDEERDAEVAHLQVRCAEAEKDRERMKAHMKEATAIIRNQYDEALQEIERQAIDIESLRAQEEKGKAVADLCDQLSYQLEQKEGECKAHVEALNNLQLVLEAVQAEHEGVKLHLESDLSSLREQVEQQQHLSRDLQESQAMVTFLQSSVTSLRSDLLTSQSALAAAQAEAATLRSSFTTTVERLKSFASDDHQIDRRLVVKLLVTYFERGQKEDTLHLMYRMLGLTEEEKERVEKGRKAKGIGGRLYGLTSYVSLLSPFDTTSQPMKVDTEDANLTDLWVDFLLKEAKEAEQSKQGGEGGGTVAVVNGSGGGAANGGSSSIAINSTSPMPPAAAT